MIMINILFFIIPQPIPGTSLEYIVSGTILTALSLESDHHVMSLQAATHHPPFFASYAYRKINHMVGMIDKRCHLWRFIVYGCKPSKFEQGCDCWIICLIYWWEGKKALP